MGLKSGSRDAGLDESDDETDREDEEEDAFDAEDTRDAGAADRPDRTTTVEDSEHDPAERGEPEQDSESTGDRPTMSSIPYKLRRDKVNEGREQVPYFLRENVIDAEDDLQDTLEEILGEDVYKSDYREAAMVVAQRNPGLIAEVLREWGYDLESE